jgi:hypothetical protein
VLLRRLFFINSDKTKYVFIGFYPTRDYQPLVEFGNIRRGGSKSIILKDELIDTLADCLPKLLVSICIGGTGAAVSCVSGAFRLSPPKKYGSARLYFGTQYISLSIRDLQYLCRMFQIVQHFPNYILALPDVLSYVT